MVSRSIVKIVFSHSTESFRRGNFLCFRKFRVSKNIMPMKRISRFSIENLLSQSTESFRRGTILCFRKFRVSKRLMDKRGGVGREYHIYLPKIFCLTVPKKYRRGTLCCVTKIRCRKSSCLNGFCFVFLSNFFCLAVHKIFVEEPFCVSESYGIGKFCA